MSDKFIEFNEQFESPAELTDNELYKEVHNLRARIDFLEVENEDMKIVLHELVNADGDDELKELLYKVQERFEESLFDEPY